MDNKRRHFISETFTLVTGTALCSALPVWATAQQENEEEVAKRKTARYTLELCSPYSDDQQNYSASMHYQFKHHVQTLSRGKIYVDVKDSGSCGIGTQLMALVSRGKIASALVSVANLSPALPELDILNIPFWSSQNQPYLNLVTSKVWRKLILDKIRSSGKVEVLFHYLPGARTLTSTKAYGKTVKTPADLAGATLRIPTSRALKHFYNLAGNQAVEIGWQDTAHMAAAGRFDLLDPGIIGLYIGPHGLRHHIGVISQIDSVYDGWMLVISQAWLNSLPLHLSMAVFEAAEQTFIEHLSAAPEASALCKQAFLNLGTRFYTPTADEKGQWIDCCGHQRPEWNSLKRHLLGDEKLFSRLLEATRESNGYTFAKIK